jgi:hypothetical protein
MKCTNEEIGKKVLDYGLKEYIADEEVEVHLLECEYCWTKVRRIEREKRLKRVEHLIKTHVSKEAFHEILKEIRKPQEEPKPILILSKDGVEIDTIAYPGHPFSWKKELPQFGLYALKDLTGFTHWQETHQQQLRFFTGKRRSKTTPEVKTIQVAASDKSETINLRISLKYERNQAILSIQSQQDI